MSEYAVMWVEKYRPKRLGDVINQSNTVQTIEKFLERPESMPHLLFSGGPGTGKTTVALCVSRSLYDERWRDFTLELNASDERGIAMVREKIKSFSRHATGRLGNVPYGLVVLDESDQMTSEAQTALRRIMETSSRTSRFILICNYASRIIEPIQSRCAIFRFSILKREDIAGFLKTVLIHEGVEFDDEGIGAVIDFSRGDLRKAVNTAQSASVLSGRLDQEAVLRVVEMASPSEIKAVVLKALRGEYNEARESLYDLLFRRGLSGVDVIKQIHTEVLQLHLPNEVTMDLVRLVADYDFRMVEGANEDIQLSALLAQLSKAGRDLGF